MKTTLFRWTSLLLFFAIFSFSTSTLQANNVKKWLQTLEDRVKTNAIDMTLFSVIAYVVNDYMLQNPELSFWESVCFVPGSLLFGHVVEAVYKKIYQFYARKSFRQSLGSTSIGSIEIDGQRLMRRIITLVPLALAFYVRGELADDFVDW